MEPRTGETQYDAMPPSFRLFAGRERVDSNINGLGCKFLFRSPGGPQAFGLDAVPKLEASCESNTSWEATSGEQELSISDFFKPFTELV
jgi:hypothetical protein